MHGDRRVSRQECLKSLRHGSGDDHILLTYDFTPEQHEDFPA